MKPLNPDYLKLWVDSWSKTYPPTYDMPLDKLRGLPNFTVEQMAALVDWKYPPPLTGRRRVRHDNIRQRLQSNGDQAVIDATETAFARNDDDGALKVVMRLSGVGMAIGSTALMAHDPARFTVYDTQASKSLRALDYLDRQRLVIECHWVSLPPIAPDMAQGTPTLGIVNASEGTELPCAPSDHVSARPALSTGRAVTDWCDTREWREVGSLVRSTGGEWMVRPPQRCGNGHPITPGHVLVESMACRCGERHLTWLCDCGNTSYGPPLGVSCSVLNGPALVR